jgi:Zn-dependent protease with chaperone function
MTKPEFDALVDRLEQQAVRHPGRYRSKVLGLALLANAYLGGVLLILTSLLIALIASIAVLKALALKLIFVVGVFLWMVLKALWVKVEPPAGIALKPAQAPALFAMIENLRQSLGAPRFHDVLMTDEFNAGVVQTPRLGIFGWHRNTLLIGLPLMKSLSVEQFKAVLAHEFGHLAKGHGRVSNWLYRQRLRWSRLAEVLESNRSKGGFLFRPFLNRFAPYFNAYSFPLARANEYEADATAVRLTSARAAAEALTGVNVGGAYLQDRYWPHIHRQADRHPQPGFMPYAEMPCFAAQADEASVQQWLDQALARETTSDDTHPALRERLRAIGEPARLAPPAPGAAADTLLGPALAGMAERLDRAWQDGIRPAWEDRYREAQAARERFAELDRRHIEGEQLPAQDAYEYAILTETVGEDTTLALERLRALHAAEPEDAAVCLSLGARLLEAEDDAGAALVEQAARLDDELMLRCGQLLRDYHWRHGREQMARDWHEKVMLHADRLDAAARERDEVNVKDTFLPHGLDPGVLEDLQRQLRMVPGLVRAYLIRKQVVHFPDRPCYVLGFKVTGPLGLHRRSKANRVLQAIQQTVRFPGETMILNVDGDHYRFARRFKRIAGARLR